MEQAPDTFCHIVIGSDRVRASKADIPFDLNGKEAAELSRDLLAWCDRPEYPFEWKD